jgi:hypothetical protein
MFKRTTTDKQGRMILDKRFLNMMSGAKSERMGSGVQREWGQA